MARPGGFVSNKPIRRLVHTGTGLGAYGRVSGLRGAQLRDNSPYQLNPSQIADLEARNPDVANMINTGATPPSGTWAIGYQFTDDVYGHVLISLAPNGWHFVANSPIADSVVNAPPYQSPVNPPGSPASCTDSLEDFASCASQYATFGLLAIGGYMLYRLLK